MKITSKTQNTSHTNSHSPKPFFSKSGERTFFSNSKEVEPPFFSPSNIQTKLTIGEQGDKYEQEADTMAEKVVQKLDTSNSTSVVQNKCDDCTQEEKLQKKDDEEMTISKKTIFESDDRINNKHIQRKENNKVSQIFETKLQNSKGSGQTLDKRTRQDMEQSFRADFSGVKVHTGQNAIQMNQNVGAQAFTNGNDIYFNRGKYNPNNKKGKKLLAHELTHVIQQKGNSTIQRKILVGGNSYKPTQKYLLWLKNNYGDAMVEFIKSMHNNDNPPNYSFADYEQMGYEVKIRSNAIKGMEEVHKGCCSYAPFGKKGYLNPTYWDKKGAYHFTMKTPLPSGKKPSDAINSIFENGAGTLLECNSIMVAIQYRAMMKGMGEDKFNLKFTNGTGVLISPHHNPQPAGMAKHPIWDKSLYKQVTISSSADLLPGDWVYFENIPDYIDKHPGGLWSGEHAMYLGDGKFRGFGIDEKTETQLIQELLNAYNDKLTPIDKKAITDVPGLRDYARRPVIEEVMK